MPPTDLKNPAQSDPADENRNAEQEVEDTSAAQESNVDMESRRVAREALRLGFDLSPLRLDQFKSEEEGETSATLDTEEIRQRALEVLHLLDEYHRVGLAGDTTSDTEVQLEGIDSLDDFLGKLNRGSGKKEKAASTEQESPTTKRREILAVRIRELLQDPQVYQSLHESLEKEAERFRSVQPLLSRLQGLRTAQSVAFEQIHTRSLKSRREHGKLTGSARKDIEKLAAWNHQAENEEQRLTESATGLEKGWIAAQRLLEYKRQLQTDGFVMTPSRRAILDDMIARLGTKGRVLLLGSNGTGKTELGAKALAIVSNGYHLVPWQESTTAQDIFGRMEIRRENGHVVSSLRPGPMTRAIEAKNGEPAGVLHDELNLGSLRTIYLLKKLWNSRPGKEADVPVLDEKRKLPLHYAEVYTANPKDERTSNREDFDAGITRVLGGMNVPFMSQEEQEQLVLCKLIDENGVLNLSRSEVEEVRNLTAAAVMTQQCFDRAFDDIGEEQLSEIRDMTGISDLRLTKKFLDPGRLMEMFDTFEQKRAEGVSTGDIIASEVQRFLSEFEVEEEQNIALSILKLKGVIAPDSTAEDVRVVQASKPNEKPYLLPSELGFLISEDGELVDDDVDFDEDLNASIEDILATDGARLLHDLNRSSTPNTSASSASIEQAAQMMLEKCGEGHFYGPEELVRTFPGLTLRPEDIPALPSPEEIERHAALGHTLRLRVSNAPDGSPLTMVKMRELLQESFTQSGEGEVLYNHDADWKLRSEFFTQDTPELAWSFTSDEVLPDSTSKNHLQQTEVLANYVRQSLFPDGQMPQEFREALEELDAEKDEIAGLIQSDWQEAARRLSQLKLNQLLRATPVETLCDLLVTFQNSNASERKRLLRSMYTWSSTLSSGGFLVNVGYFGSEGVDVGGDDPGYSRDSLGVVLSRKFRDT
ncbi:AAA family ATPase [Candidatus Peribacteria bacterium]|nr:AAA family ATPase [Candidatus Peribacteria bacterium]